MISGPSDASGACERGPADAPGWPSSCGSRKTTPSSARRGARAVGDGSSGSGGRAKGGPREGERRLGAGAGWVEVVAGGAEELSAGVPDSSGECGGGERAKRWPRGDGSHARRASALDLSTVPRARRALEHRLALPSLVDDDRSPPLVLRSTACSSQSTPARPSAPLAPCRGPRSLSPSPAQLFFASRSPDPGRSRRLSRPSVRGGSGPAG